VNEQHIVIAASTTNRGTDGFGDSSVVSAVGRSLRTDGVALDILELASSADLHRLDRLPARAIVFPACRRLADNTSLVEALEDRGVFVVGGGRVAGQAENKLFMKAMLASRGIATPAWSDRPRDVAALGCPLVGKPVAGAESIGVCHLDSTAAAVAYLSAGNRFVEQWHRRSEYTVAIMGNGSHPQAAAIEVVLEPNDVILSAEIKEQRIAATMHAPTDPSADRAIAVAVAAFAALGLRDWARVDVVLDRHGDPYVVDVNALPGLRIDPQNPSFYPKCFAVGRGASYETMVRALAGTAMSRYGLELPPLIAEACEAVGNNARTWTGPLPTPTPARSGP
jgi:D-alanine-D-alanine ligase